jgi:hypothetical protein
MADWKQITARIRRARSGKDPAGQLTNLFSKTRDAMVAFELARYFESKGNTADAGRWYLTAAERFRRADWKTKAQESATRLGATEPAEIPASTPREPEAASATPSESQETAPQADVGEQESSASVSVESDESPSQPVETRTSSSDSSRHRRGRRGGRDQRHIRRGTTSASTRTHVAETASARKTEEGEDRPATPSRSETLTEAPAVPSIRGRFGDPGLASRMTQLEMNFRRLLACSPCSLGDADKAPAGPGVWVLTDSDLSTYYYVEPCQTLRVAIPHLLRGSSAKRGESIKPRLAEHLGIPEARVGKYLADHCVVRWLQMDEGASHFAHFLIAVLHPALNE